MASIATSNITQVNYNDSTLSISGAPLEHWRIASGAATGDTAVITPARMGLVRGVIGPVSHNTPATGATNVTVTLIGGTATIGQIDVFVLGFPR